MRTPASGPEAVSVIAAPYSAPTLRGRPDDRCRSSWPENEEATVDGAPSTTAVEGLLETLERWLASDVVPHVLELEHADEYPHAMVEQMREFGLFAATIPEEYGGLGLGASAYVRIVETIARAWMSLTGVVNTHLMVAELVRRFGTDEQRAPFLPRLAAAELRGGLALTEPDCGTDLQAVRTTATRDGRRLRAARHQDVDHQRARGQLPRRAHQDRRRRRAAPPRHVAVHRAQGRSATR